MVWSEQPLPQPLRRLREKSSFVKLLLVLHKGASFHQLIWNVVFEPLLERLAKHTDATGFADDGSIVASGFSSKECARRLQLSLNAAIKWGRENGLEFAPEKTVMIQFAKK